MVTGGAGYIGSHVVARLRADGMHVAVADDFSRGTTTMLIPALRAGLSERDILRLDVADATAIDAVVRWRPDVIVHLAAQSLVRESLRDPLRDARSNVLGTLAMIEAAVRRPGCKFIFTSSGGAVNGDLASPDARAAEADVRRPISPYGVSKLSGNLYLDAYRATTGLDFTALMLGNVYGRDTCGEPGVGIVGDFARQLARREPPTVFGNGRQVRDYVHVSDVAEAIRLAFDAPAGDCLNIGTGRPVTVNEIHRLLCAALGVSIAPRYRPANAGEVRNICLDPSRAAARLGWKPVVTLEQGIADVAAGLLSGMSGR
jgi:UDP-glucose 4-epimerase